MENTSNFVVAAKKTDCPIGSGTCVTVNGRAVALFNVNGKIHAIDNACVHRGGPLAEGTLEGSDVTCPWHGWTYDVTTGAGTTNPQAQVASYVVKEEGENILIMSP